MVNIKNCPLCNEKVKIKIYQKQEINTKIICNLCDARWLVPNTYLKEDAEFKEFNPKNNKVL